MENATKIIETLYNFVDSQWSLVQEYDRLGFEDGVALYDPSGNKILHIEQEAYRKFTNW